MTLARLRNGSRQTRSALTDSPADPRALLRKLALAGRLSEEEKLAVAKAVGDRTRLVAAREDIIYEGDCPSGTHLILDGFACRYRTLEDGRRQIFGVLVPGDMSRPDAIPLQEMDHSIAALSATRVVEISPQGMASLLRVSERVRQALRRSELTELSIAREWIVSVGQRRAFERLAHLFCELFLRLRAVGLADRNCCEIPMTQTDLGDALGLSSVHVNRVLQDLRARGLITLRGKLLVIHDFPGLQDAGLFKPSYLGLDDRSLSDRDHGGLLDGLFETETERSGA